MIASSLEGYLLGAGVLKTVERFLLFPGGLLMFFMNLYLLIIGLIILGLIYLFKIKLAINVNKKKDRRYNNVEN